VPASAVPSLEPVDPLAGADGDLVSADAFLRSIWDGITACLLIYGPDRERLMMNPAAHRACKDGLGRVAARVVYLADGMSLCPDHELPLTRALGGGTVRNEELVICDEAHPDGRRMLVSAFPLMLPDQRGGALVSLYDVPERWRDEQSNRTTVEQLNLLLNGAAGYAILRLSPVGIVHSWSENAARLLGYSPREIVGQPYAVLFGMQDRGSGVPEAILAQARDDGTAQTSGQRVRRDGSTFWANGVMTAIRDRGGDVTAFVKVIHDVTPQVEAERSVDELNRKLVRLNEDLEERVRDRTAMLEELTAELMGANSELEAFSYSVSHDLRAPVRAIKGFSRIVREQYRHLLPEEGDRHLQRIEDGAARMGELIDALLRLSRMQRQPMEARAVDMNDLVRRCWETLTAGRVDGGPELSADPLLPALGDPSLLRQVWMNLLDNAIKYSAGRDNPTVAVTSRAMGDRVVYSVQDNGAGFDPRYAAKLFKVFQRLHRTEDFEGIGIGLAIVQRVVLRHGGTVDAISEPGHGATFSFALPAGDGPPQRPVERPVELTVELTETDVEHVG
jgi:PAS domain S-box-containing protein